MPSNELYLVGSVFPYAGPLTDANVVNSLNAAGFVPCDGRPLSKKPDSPYIGLYRVIGDSFGADETNFYVPDLRGRFVRATDYGSGNDPDPVQRKAPRTDLPQKGNAGDKVGSVQESTFQDHKHTFQMKSGDNKCNEGSLSSGRVHKKLTTPNFSQSQLVGGNETRPKNQYANFLIAYK